MPSIYPELQEMLPAAEDFNGTALSANLAELDAIAASLDLVTLGSLIDARAMALEVLEESQIPANCPPVQWYLPQVGLATVQRLLSHLEQLPDRDAVSAELLNLDAILAQAKERNLRFHLLVEI